MRGDGTHGDGEHHRYTLRGKRPACLCFPYRVAPMLAIGVRLASVVRCLGAVFI